MKKLYVLIFAVALMIILCAFASASGIYAESADGRTFESDSGNNLFLPSYFNPREIKLTFNSDILYYLDKSGNEVYLPSGSILDITPFETEIEGNFVVNLVIGNSRFNLKIYIASDLPSVHIETSAGIDKIIDENGKDTAVKITVINKDGSYQYDDNDSALSQIKVRGNTTKDYLKKPYQIKLAEKTDLFGMGKAKTWILLANYLDHSLLRNSVMYQIGSILGMKTCDFKSVDVYIDGEYHGIYLLCEKVEISSTRLNIHELEKDNDILNPTYGAQIKVFSGTLMNETIITEYAYIDGVVNPDDITGGYLIELDNNYWSGELCYFVTSYGNHYVIKSPEYSSKEEVEYIARLFGEMEEAIMATDGKNRLGKHYSEYIDVDSFAYAYIVAELGRNYDAGSSSMYFYKDRDVNGVTSKIFKGPLWDCDNTLGNFNKNNASATDGFWAKDRSIWKGLNQKEEFRKKVSLVFEEAYNEIFNMIDGDGFISKEVKLIGTSINMERLRWKSNNYSTWPMYYVYKDVHYDTWQGQWAPCFNFFDVYSDGRDEGNTTIAFLSNHIEDRVNWLAREWGCNVSIRKRNLDTKFEGEIVDSQQNQNSQSSTLIPDNGLDDEINEYIPQGNNGSNIGVIIVIVVLSLISAASVTLAVILLIKRK